MRLDGARSFGPHRLARQRVVRCPLEAEPAGRPAEEGSPDRVGNPWGNPWIVRHASPPSRLRGGGYRRWHGELTTDPIADAVKIA